MNLGKIALSFIISFTLSFSHYSIAMELEELNAELETMEKLIDQNQKAEVDSEEVDIYKNKIVKRLNKLIEREEKRPTNKDRALKRIKRKLSRSQNIEGKFIQRLLRKPRKRKKFYKKLIEPENVFASPKEFNHFLKKRQVNHPKVYAEIKLKATERINASKSYKEYLEGLLQSVKDGDIVDALFLMAKKNKSKQSDRDIASVTVNKVVWILVTIALFGGGILAMALFGLGVLAGLAGFLGMIWVFAVKKHKIHAPTDRQIDRKNDYKNDEKLISLKNNFSEEEPNETILENNIVINSKNAKGTFKVEDITTGLFRFEKNGDWRTRVDYTLYKEKDENGNLKFSHSIFEHNRFRGELGPYPVIFHSDEGILELTRGKKCSFWLKITSSRNRYKFAKCNKKFNKNVTR